MPRSALSAKVFAVYLFVIGPLLALVPNLLLPPFGFEAAHEVWVRALGVVVFNLGVYVWVAARHRPLLEASVYTRILTFVSFTGFAALGLASPMIILFGAIDLCGGVWTWFALRADERAGVALPARAAPNRRA